MELQKEAEALVNEFFHLNSPNMDDVYAFMSWSLAKQCALLHLDKVARELLKKCNSSDRIFIHNMLLKNAVENL